jgi:hypothetical protein
MDTTTVVPPEWGGTVDPYGNLVLEPLKLTHETSAK